jgi:hypothetical protein
MARAFQTKDNKINETEAYGVPGGRHGALEAVAAGR